MQHIKDLTPDPTNRRRHNPRNLGMVADSLQRVGAARSIVIDEDGVILAGNGVVEAAAEVGITNMQIVEADGQTIIAVRRSGLTPEQKRHLAIADNRTSELAEWNVEQLAADAAAGLDLKPFFFEGELRDLLGTTPTAGRTDPDAVPAPRATSVTRGDLFELGPHRLLCGDCTTAEAIARLPVPSLVFGDPPYGMALDTATADRRRGFYGGTTIDEVNAPWDATLHATWIARWAERVTPAGYLASWTPYQGVGTIEQHALAAGLLWLNLFTWVKENPPPGFPEYLAKSCEYACIFRKPGAGRYIGPDLVRDYAVTSVTPQSERFGDHPSPKRVDVIGPIIGKLTPLGAVVADPFLGSGTSIIACEQIGRVCVGTEIDPTYCQVIIDRWEAFSGARAVKVGGEVTI